MKYLATNLDFQIKENIKYIKYIKKLSNAKFWYSFAYDGLKRLEHENKIKNCKNENILYKKILKLLNSRNLTFYFQKSKEETNIKELIFSFEKDLKENLLIIKKLKEQYQIYPFLKTENTIKDYNLDNRLIKLLIKYLKQIENKNYLLEKKDGIL